MTNSQEKINFKLLKPAINQTAYLKCGILGFAGSGKTFTASEIALGLSNLMGNKKPVAFFDTETGSDFMIPRFKKAGVELLVVKSRAFVDLLSVVREAEQGCLVLIIDSISHVWQELMDAYCRRLGRKNGLLFQDWAALKAEWRQFTDLYVNSKLHIILCGRAGYEYDFEENEAGKKELIKTGTKMKAETEMGYEPSLLMEMVRLKKSEISGDVHDRGWINRCVVLKDRTNIMNGMEVDYPTFESFKPIIDFLNLGGEHIGVDTTRNSEELFEHPDRSWNERRKRSDIALEEINQELILQGLDGTSADAKKKRTELLIDIFGSSSKTAIESQSLEKLQAGLEKIKMKRQNEQSIQKEGL